ncbi:hypothetical protein FJZ31_16730 [Candidatus Poribacteria bacterium]|nr:hypothetical protein [Candidatus Poribacteria bacterium]
MTKIVIVSVLAISISLTWATDTFADAFEAKLALTGEPGISKYFVAPDVNLPLSGANIEINGAYKRNDISYGISFQYSRVLRGAIDVDVVSITAGTRYSIPMNKYSPYFSFDIGPCWLFSRNKKDVKTGYVLDTGIRPVIRYGAGIAYNLNQYLTLEPNIKYNFTVKRVYFHNPFLPHKHEDIFHYFSFNLGLEGRRS